ncbi:MAG: hypothetical protein J6A15_04955 [Clostridia bacterium]|nr:hypothetical protein [Clostridia bacterium]
MRKIKLFIALIILNLVFIPNIYGYETGREVFVRHINKDTGNIITNLSSGTQEVIDASGNVSLLSKTTSDDAEIEYNEYYNHDISSTMRIAKSLVVKSDAKMYTYLGANVCTMYSLDDAYEIMEQKKSTYRAGISSLDIPYNNSTATSQYTTIQSNSNDVTMIDFYYTEIDSSDIAPLLLSNTNVSTNNDAQLLTQITYVPAGGKLIPYFVTPKYIVKDLAYEKVIENGIVRYQVNKFTVYRLENSYLMSSDNVNKNGIEISGNLVGSSHDTVLSGLSGTIDLPVTGAAKTEITNELNNLLATSTTTEIPGNNAIDFVTSEKSAESDFVSDGFIVDYKKYNGLRSAKGTVVYTTYNVLSGQSFGGMEKVSQNEHFINVYTPIQMAMPEITTTSASTINHSNTSSSTVILADDASFEIKLRCTNSDLAYYNNVTDYMIADFVDYYYLIFDFDIIHNGRTYNKGTAIRIRNTARQRDGYTYFTGTVAPNETLSVDATNHKIIVLAQASNMNSSELLQYVVDQEVAIQIDKTQDSSDRKYINDSGNNKVSFDNDINAVTSYNDPYYTENKRFYADGYYFAMQTINVRTVSRIYDFKISDCTDLSYKNVFRNADSYNSLTGKNYYSGIRRMIVYINQNKEYTTLVNRSMNVQEENNIAIKGAATTTTLPLGPYKHTTASYMKAPKLGYRFAFDLKTTGYYTASAGVNGSRKIKIKPTYYYISKDGSTLIRDITLYYKDASDKYKRFEGSNYTIYFTPNDGYRYKSNSTTSNVSSLSTKQEALNIASSSGEFYLTDKMMSSDDTNYIQSWYGEFKLPNTTIAVKNGESIDNKLTDGYIGVKFEIECVDSNLGQTISYNSNNKSVASRVNTTQWDYEGYLGFTNIGQPVTENSSLRLQLEKGIWAIKTQDVYEFVKGTVILYDIDERAADDIQ